MIHRILNKHMSHLKKTNKPDLSWGRRQFISRSGLALLGTLIGSKIVNGHLMPEEYTPVIFDDLALDPMRDKHKDLVVLNDLPWNVETPPHLLDDKVTPAEKMFIRNNGKIPESIDIDNWKLTLDGEALDRPVVLSLQDLKSKFKSYTYQLVIECGGNGRAEFNPPTKGNQWTYGAVSCARWTGVRLKDVLEYAGVKDNAVYVGYYGADKHLSGDLNKVVISRGIPIEKALEDETLLAFQMNGEDIPLAHGYPLRLVVGGWPASVSGKWLEKLAIRNKVHDGPKMEAPSYRVPCEPVEPGENVPDKNMCIIESMPVKSLITYPKTGGILKNKSKLTIRGHAWAGDLSVKKVEVSLDFGATWQEANLEPPANRLSWQHWYAEITLLQKGYYEIWARATDSHGKAQPMVSPGWNPKGYLNNTCHRIAIKKV